MYLIPSSFSSGDNDVCGSSAPFHCPLIMNEITCSSSDPHMMLLSEFSIIEFILIRILNIMGEMIERSFHPTHFFILHSHLLLMLPWKTLNLSLLKFTALIFTLQTIKLEGYTTIRESPPCVARRGLKRMIGAMFQFCPAVVKLTGNLFTCECRHQHQEYSAAD